MNAPSPAAANQRRLWVLIASALALAASAWPMVEVLRGSDARGWAGLTFGSAASDSASPQRARLLSQGGTIVAVVRNGPAARAGIDGRDKVAAVNGIPIAERARLAALDSLSRPGDRVRYTVNRAGKARDVDVTLTARLAGTSFAVRALLFAGLALAFVAPGAFVFWRLPLDPRAVVFHLLCACLACSFLALPVTTAGESARGLVPGMGLAAAAYVSFVVALGCTFLFLSLLTHFTLVFPRERPWLSERPQVLHWAYAATVLPIAMIAASLVTVFYERIGPWASGVATVLFAAGTAWAWGPGRRAGRGLRERPWAITTTLTALLLVGGWIVRLGGEAAWAKAARITLLAVGVGIPFIALFAALFVLPALAIAVLIRSYRASGVEERQQIRWPLWALVFSLGSTALISAIAIVVATIAGPNWALRWQTPFEGVSSALYLLIPIGFAVGILKYRLMDLDVVIRKTAVYGAVTSLMILLYLVLAGFLGGWIVQSLRVQSTWVTVIATLTVAAVFVPARNRVQAIVDRRFFRTRYEAPESLGRLSRALGIATDARGFGAAVADEVVRALRPRTIAILAAHRDARALEPVASLGVAEDRIPGLALARTATLAAAVPAEIALVDSLAGPLADAARAARAKLVVPVRRQGELLGLILLGPKVSDEDYDEHDLEYLGAVAGQLAIGFGQTPSHVQRRELDEAREIQAGLLPRSLPTLTGFALAAHWQPAREVAGDYYDVVPLGVDRVALCIADVTGKGMPAALLMSNLQATVKTFAATAESPDALCRRVNRIMATNMAPGRFITLFYGVLDAASRTLAYTNAGHNPPLLLRHDGTCETLETGGLLLGAFPEADYGQARIELRPGDRLVLFTDGLVEAENATRELYGDDRLLETLRRHASDSAEELQRRILAAAAEHCGGEFQDDATLIVVAVS